jgi:hypothetical protein
MYTLRERKRVRLQSLISWLWSKPPDPTVPVRTIAVGLGGNTTVVTAASSGIDWALNSAVEFPQLTVLSYV